MSPHTALAPHGAEGRAGEQAPDLPRYVVIEDVQAIRALAHEARLTALDELYGTHRVYTATELAKLCEVSPSSMSYHLRALEKYGYIRRVKHDGDGRNRYWQAAGMTLRVSGFDSSAHAKSVYANAQIEALQRRVSEEIRRREQALAARPEKLHPILSAGVLSLDAAKADEFLERLHALRAEFELVSGAHLEAEPDRRINYFISAIEEPGREAH